MRCGTMHMPPSPVIINTILEIQAHGKVCGMLTTVEPLRKQYERCLGVHDLVHSFLYGIASKECHSQGQLLLSKATCGVEGALWETGLPNLYQNLLKFLERKLAACQASRGLAAFKTKCLPLCKKSCVSW